VTLGVVVSCYRQERWLAGTIAALEAALGGHDWQGVLEFAAPSDAPLPALDRRWRLLRSYDAATGAPRRRLTPGAGRMAGFRACAGEWVLFLDSDVALEPAWLEAALALGRAEARIGGVGGRLEEWFREGEQTRLNAADMYGVGSADRDMEYLAALVLYRREALEEAGGYDERLNSDEDFELGLRFGWAGWRLRALSRLGGRHWSAPRPSFTELARRWRTGLTLGRGQVLRLYLGRRGFFRLLRHQALYAAALGLWLLGAAALALSVARLDPRPFALWLALPALVVAVMWARKRSALLAGHALLSWTVNGLGLVTGFVAPPLPIPLGGAVDVRPHRAESPC
jgi:hypothetical protein